MQTRPRNNNPEHIQHQEGKFMKHIKEIVFGMQDGMVSTLGALTGIAIGSESHFVIILAGVAIISVESISMGIGTYTSSRSEKKLMDHVLREEHKEVKDFPKKGSEELHGLFVDDGWSPELAHSMAEEASKNHRLMLQEMMYRELKIIPNGQGQPIVNGLFMFFAYIVGGFIPLSTYFFLPLGNALQMSVGMTLIGLFILGASISKYTKEKWYRTGSHMLFFGGVALIVGYAIGDYAHTLI